MPDAVAEPLRVERHREQARDHVVASLREADLELLIRSAVQLGRTSGTGPCPARESPVLGTEQPGLDQAIEVERGQRTSDPDRRRRLVAPDRVRSADDVQVQGPTDRFGQRCDRVEAIFDRGGIHAVHSNASRGSRIIDTVMPGLGN